MSDELKPCPLCSGTPLLRDFSGWEIHCKCGLTHCIESPEKADVIAAWNTRAQLSAQSVSAVQPVAWMWEYHGKRVTPDKAEADAIAADVPVTALVHQRAADADAVDAKRYRWATALEDNAEMLYSILMCHGGDQAKINDRVDAYRLAQSTEGAKG